MDKQICAIIRKELEKLDYNCNFATSTIYQVPLYQEWNCMFLGIATGIKMYENGCYYVLHFSIWAKATEGFRVNIGGKFYPVANVGDIAADIIKEFERQDKVSEAPVVEAPAVIVEAPAAVKRSFVGKGALSHDEVQHICTTLRDHLDEDVRQRVALTTDDTTVFIQVANPSRERQWRPMYVARKSDMIGLYIGKRCLATGGLATIIDVIGGIVLSHY